MSIVFLSIGLLLAGFCFILWFVLKWYRLQQALRWWYRQHVLRLFDEAEVVRNGVLQDAFTLRRTLELSSVQHEVVPSELYSTLITNADGEFLFTTLENLQDSLKRFCDFLSPPYLEDSFPLAIDHLLKSHQQQHPHIHLKLSLPEHWQPTAYDQSRIVWIAIDEFLRLALTQLPSVRSISTCLTQQTNDYRLVVKIFYSNSHQKKLHRAIKELPNLRRAAQFLTAGTCTYQEDHEGLVWSMYWS